MGMEHNWGQVKSSTEIFLLRQVRKPASSLNKSNTHLTSAQSASGPTYLTAKPEKMIRDKPSPSAWSCSQPHTCCVPSCFSHVQLFVSPRAVACRASLSMGFSRQEYWSGLPFPSPGYLPDPGIEPSSPALKADTLPSEPPGNSFTLNGSQRHLWTRCYLHRVLHDFGTSHPYLRCPLDWLICIAVQTSQSPNPGSYQGPHTDILFSLSLGHAEPQYLQSLGYTKLPPCYHTEITYLIKEIAH